MKTYKGYELLKAIANNEIKEGTKFKNLNQKVKSDNSHIYAYNHNNFMGRWGRPNIIAILNDEFEIIEEQEEIDIQEIKELYIGDVTTEDKLRINELVRAVKQLDKKIKEKQ